MEWTMKSIFKRLCVFVIPHVNTKWPHDFLHSDGEQISAEANRRKRRGTGKKNDSLSWVVEKSKSKTNSFSCRVCSNSLSRWYHLGYPHSQNPSDMGIPCNPNPNPNRLGFWEWGCRSLWYRHLRNEKKTRSSWLSQRLLGLPLGTWLTGDKNCPIADRCLRPVRPQ